MEQSFIQKNKNMNELMPIDGIEPPTFALQERRSTTKPNRHFIGKIINSKRFYNILNIKIIKQYVEIITELKSQFQLFTFQYTFN